MRQEPKYLWSFDEKKQRRKISRYCPFKRSIARSGSPLHGDIVVVIFPLMTDLLV
jgi:hypothetical protein